MKEREEFEKGITEFLGITDPAVIKARWTTHEVINGKLKELERLSKEISELGGTVVLLAGYVELIEKGPKLGVMLAPALTYVAGRDQHVKYLVRNSSTEMELKAVTTIAEGLIDAHEKEVVRVLMLRELFELKNEDSKDKEETDLEIKDVQSSVEQQMENLRSFMEGTD